MAANQYSMRFNQEDSWRNMEKAFMANEPVLDHGGFAGTVIVQDNRNLRIFGDRSVSHLQELEKFLYPMSGEYQDQTITLAGESCGSGAFIQR